jgi:hypothetical protein
MSVNVKCETFSRNVTSGPGMMLPERVFICMQMQQNECKGEEVKVYSVCQ